MPENENLELTTEDAESEPTFDPVTGMSQYEEISHSKSFMDDMDNMYADKLQNLIDQNELIIRKLDGYVESCNSILEQTSELILSCNDLKLDLAKSRAELITATGNCQSAINQINSGLKDAAEFYIKLAEDYDTTIRKSMLDVIDKASNDLMENLARNYKELHFSVERWNRSGAIGGLYFVKYGLILLVFMSLINLSLMAFMIYQLK